MTTFHYGETGSLSRWLTEKAYADATSVTYTRRPDGKLETRTWARQVGPNEDEDLITEYVYDDDTGELTEVRFLSSHLVP